jgi:hypothetical protein
MDYEIKSPSGKIISCYGRKEALYAAEGLADIERRFEGRQEPVSVYERGSKVAAVWANAMEIWN